MPAPAPPPFRPKGLWLTLAIEDPALQTHVRTSYGTGPQLCLLTVKPAEPQQLETKSADAPAPEAETEAETSEALWDLAARMMKDRSVVGVQLYVSMATVEEKTLDVVMHLKPRGLEQLQTMRRKYLGPLRDRVALEASPAIVIASGFATLEDAEACAVEANTVLAQEAPTVRVSGIDLA